MKHFERGAETRWPLLPTFWAFPSDSPCWITSCFMKLEQKAWGCSSFFSTLNEGAGEIGRSVWPWKQPFILLNGALLQPWGVFLRVPCQGNSILATVEAIPCRLPLSSHMAHLCFCLTHKCTSQERHVSGFIHCIPGSLERFTPLVRMLHYRENLLCITGWVLCTKRTFR